MEGFSFPPMPEPLTPEQEVEEYQRILLRTQQERALRRLAQRRNLSKYNEPALGEHE